MSAAITDRPRPSRDASRRAAPDRRRGWLTAGVLIALILVSTWSLVETLPHSGQFDRTISYAMRFLQRTVPFTWPPLTEILWLSAVTVAIAICGTVLAGIAALPIAVLAARNVGRSRLAVAIGRAIGVFTRAIPDAFLVLILAMVVSRGALPGILAIGIHSIGMISKLTADAIEQIDEGPRTALRAAGATPAQQFWGAIWPQVTPSYVATMLHRTDINLRGSVILGIVGVPGLGYELGQALSTLDYTRAGPYALALLLLCLLFEVIASLVRAELLGHIPSGRSLGARFARRRAHRRTSRLTPTATTLPRAGDRSKALWSGGAAAVLLGSFGLAMTMAGPQGSVLANAAIAWQRLFPPSLAPEKWADVAQAFAETIQIALAATVIALAASLVIGPLAARGVTTVGGMRPAMRVVLVTIRGIPELLLAFFLVILTGLGPGAAVIALGIGGIGLLGKLYADSIEEVKRGPALAVRSAGGTALQSFATTTFRQSAPALVGHTLYLLDSNVRSAAILGVIGAGGIGMMMDEASRLDQHEFAMLVILLFVVVSGVEALSAWIRSQLT